MTVVGGYGPVAEEADAAWQASAAAPGVRSCNPLRGSVHHVTVVQEEEAADGADTAGGRSSWADKGAELLFIKRRL